MNHCPECGGRVDDSFNACPACGKVLEQAKAVSRLNRTAGSKQSVATTPPSEERRAPSRPSTEYGMSSKGQIWSGSGQGGSAPPKPQKARANAREEAPARPPPTVGSGAAGSDAGPGGPREIEVGEEMLGGGAASGAEAYTCYRCGGPLRFIQEYGRWYCDSCYSYV